MLPLLFAPSGKTTAEIQVSESAADLTLKLQDLDTVGTVSVSEESMDSAVSQVSCDAPDGGPKSM